jgi:hypothetical protein
MSGARVRRRRLYGCAEYGTHVEPRRGKGNGPDRDRTGDLLNAIQARSQLRYRPTSRTRDIHASTRHVGDYSAAGELLFAQAKPPL